MRLTNAWILAVATTATTSVHGFQTSSSQRVATTTSLQVTKDADLESLYKVSSSSATMTTNGATNGAMTYTDINSLAFRALQKQCKELGLSAVGTTAALRGRLLEHYSLAREVTTVVEVPKATASEIEVRSFMQMICY